MSTPARRPAGSPAGGQFAPTSHAESAVDLDGGIPDSAAGLVDRQTAEIAAYELNEQGRWAVVERVWDVESVSGTLVAGGFRTTGFDDEAAMQAHLSAKGFQVADLENPDEAPDVDYWAATQPVEDDRPVQVSRTRTVEVFDPDA